MKFPRIISHRRLKWIGMSLSGATAVLYVLSLFVSIGYQHHSAKRMLNHEVQLSAGRLEMERYNPSRASATWYFKTHWWVRWNNAPRLNVIPFVRWGDWYSAMHTPLWLPLLLFALPTARLWWIDRKAKPWECSKCQYDLRGIESGICPECGKSIEDSTVAQVNRPDESPALD